MKKFIIVLLFLVTANFLFANRWEFTLGTALQLSTANQPVAAPETSTNHFETINGISIPVPLCQFVASYSIPLNFGESPIFQDANVAFIAGPSLTPITFENQIAVVFTPSPIINFSIGAVAGTGWDLFGAHGIAKYNPDTDSYNGLTPFVNWKYDLVAQVNFQFDFGAVIQNEWAHVITTANYTVLYEGLSSAQKYEPWFYLSSENVNGFMYSASFALGYMFPWKFKMILFGAGFSSHYDGSDYGTYNSNYNGSFTEVSLSLQGVIELNEKNTIVISTAVPSRRGVLEKTNNGDAYISKTQTDREWFFNGITLQWVLKF